MGDRSTRFRARLAAQRTPPDVRAIADAAGERLLTWGRDSGGEPLVATEHGIWAYGDHLRWSDIDHVGWADGVLAIRAIDGETRTVAVGEDRDLPAVIRAQIDASIVAATAVPLVASGKGATIVARRGAGSEIEWRVRYDPGVPTDDPGLQARVDAAVVAMRGELGI